MACHPAGRIELRDSRELLRTVSTREIGETSKVEFRVHPRSRPNRPSLPGQRSLLNRQFRLGEGSIDQAAKFSSEPLAPS